MEDPEDDNRVYLSVHGVRHDVWGPDDHQLPGVRDPTGTAHSRIIGQQAYPLVKNVTRPDRSSEIVFQQGIEELSEVGFCLAEPEDSQPWALARIFSSTSAITAP